MEIGVGFQAIADLLQIISKFLGRTVVQRQLIVIALIVIVTWYGSKPLVRWLGRLYSRWLAGQRRRVVEAGSESVTEDADVRRSLQIIRPMIEIAQLIVFPLVAIVLTMLANSLFQAIGWFSGLLLDVVRLLVLFLLYRLFVGILFALFDEKKVSHYQARLFRPLFAMAVILLVVNGISELTTLYRAPLFPLLGGELTLGTLFLATVGLYLWVEGTGLLVDILQSLFTRGTRADPGAVEASLILLRYFLIAAAVMIIFQLIGFNITTLAAVLGGLSVGIGFALQDVLKNFLGGIILLFEGSIRPGDWIAVGDKVGRVESLSIRSTVVRTIDNIEYIVPNQEHLSSTIAAYTYSSRSLMIKVPVGVSYDSDIREVQEVLVEIARHHEDILPKPEPVAPLVRFGESSIDFELRAWVGDVSYSAGIEASLRTKIMGAFAERGIVIPNNQLDVHIFNTLSGANANSPKDSDTP
jgi:small-conductance mechanosensitive channel